MIPILIPVVSAAAVALAMWKRSRGGKAAAATTTAGGNALTLLAACMKAGIAPPPKVIERAIGEAMMMGDLETANALVRAFVMPVMHGQMQAETPADATPAEDSPPDAAEPGAPAGGSGDDLFAQAEAAQAARDAKAPPPPAQDSDTVTVSGLSSPIKDVDNEEWCAFVEKLEREGEDFRGPRHVGAFRQRIDRLRELGIDPATLTTKADQVRALEREMNDAYAHAAEGGLVDQYVATTVAIPNPKGKSVEHEITLSGLLGLVQAAGLDGATEWLENPADRKRFPHTTKMFLQTNGVF